MLMVVRHDERDLGDIALRLAIVASDSYESVVELGDQSESVLIVDTGETLNLVGGQVGVEGEETQIGRTVREVVVKGDQPPVIIGPDRTNSEVELLVDRHDVPLEPRGIPLGDDRTPVGLRGLSHPTLLQLENGYVYLRVGAEPVTS